MFLFSQRITPGDQRRQQEAGCGAKHEQQLETQGRSFVRAGDGRRVVAGKRQQTQRKRRADGQGYLGRQGPDREVQAVRSSPLWRRSTSMTSAFIEFGITQNEPARKPVTAVIGSIQ